MKRSSIFATALVLISTLVASSAAQAVMVNYSGTNTNMGVLNYGQFGVLNNNYVIKHISATENFDVSQAFGYLKAKEKVTFTYTLPGLLIGTASMHGSYSYVLSGNTYAGEADANSDTGNSSSGQTNGFSSSPLVFATAMVGTNIARTTIVNISHGLVNFKTFFSGVLLRGFTGPSLTYNVSTVPLPAALPMFALLIGGFFGFSQLSRQRKSLALAA